MTRHFLAILLFLSLPGAAPAQTGSLFVKSVWSGEAAGEPGQARRLSSAFAGRAGLFAERPEAEPAFASAPWRGVGGSDVLILREIIGQAESRRDGYDAVQHGARVRPPRAPTRMTLGEIYAWIDATPGQPHAIGRYQFIPKTLRRVAARVGAGPGERFTPALQDRLADVLLAEAGLHQFRAGALPREAFMLNLAKIWAGLPTRSGRSYYDGYAGNAASISWAAFEAAMLRASPV